MQTVDWEKQHLKNFLSMSSTIESIRLPHPQKGVPSTGDHSSPGAKGPHTNNILIGSVVFVGLISVSHTVAQTCRPTTSYTRDGHGLGPSMGWVGIGLG